MQVSFMSANAHRKADPSGLGRTSAVPCTAGTPAEWHAAAALQPGQSCIAAWRVAAVAARALSAGSAISKQAATPFCAGAGAANRLLYLVRNRIELSWLDSRVGAGHAVGGAWSIGHDR